MKFDDVIIFFFNKTMVDTEKWDGFENWKNLDSGYQIKVIGTLRVGHFATLVHQKSRRSCNWSV